MTLRKLFDPLKSRELLIAIGALVLMEGIAYSGNPHISNSILYWHQIPEVVSSYYIGAWACIVKVSGKLVLGSYFLVVLIVLVFITGFRVPLFVLLLGSPLLLGFYLQTHRNRTSIILAVGEE